MIKEVRDLRPMVASLAALSFVASTMLSLSLGLTIVGARMAETEEGEQFAAIGGLQIAMTCLAIVLCLPGVVRLSVRRDARRIALWQVIGASPRRARARYALLASVGSLVGSLLGGAGAFLSWPLFAWAVKETGFLRASGLNAPLVVGGWLFGPASSFLVVAVSVFLSSSRLVRIEPVRAVVTSPEKGAPAGVVRAVFSLAIVAGIAAGYVAIANVSPAPEDFDAISGILSAYWGAALGLLLAYGISDRVMIRPVVWLVGAVIPLHRMDGWVLAKTSARRRATLSTSVITPLVVAASSVGAVFGMVAQAKNVMAAVGAEEADLQISPTSQIILVFGAPVIIAACSGIAAVYLTNEWRRHDIALLQFLGATVGSIRAAAIFECLIYFLSSAIIATGILSLNALAMGNALAAGPVPGGSPAWFGLQTYYLLAAGFVLLSASVIVPTVRQSRRLCMSHISG